MPDGPAKTAPGTPNEPRSLVFRARHRLTHNREYQAVYAHKLRKSRGPLTLHAMPSARPEPRLGLSIGRPVGNAVQRGALKRRLREAFRHLRPEIPRPPGGSTSYDLIVRARAHEAMTTAAYSDLMRALLEDIDAETRRRARRDGTRP